MKSSGVFSFILQIISRYIAVITKLGMRSSLAYLNTYKLLFS